MKIVTRLLVFFAVSAALAQPIKPVKTFQIEKLLPESAILDYKATPDGLAILTRSRIASEVLFLDRNGVLVSRLPLAMPIQFIAVTSGNVALAYNKGAKHVLIEGVSRVATNANDFPPIRDHDENIGGIFYLEGSLHASRSEGIFRYTASGKQPITLQSVTPTDDVTGFLQVSGEKVGILSLIRPALMVFNGGGAVLSRKELRSPAIVAKLPRLDKDEGTVMSYCSDVVAQRIFITVEYGPQRGAIVDEFTADGEFVKSHHLVVPTFESLIQPVVTKGSASYGNPLGYVPPSLMLASGSRVYYLHPNRGQVVAYDLPGR